MPCTGLSLWGYEQLPDRDRPGWFRPSPGRWRMAASQRERAVARGARGWNETRIPAMLAALAVAVLTTGCDYPFGSCEREYIEATLPATLTGTSPATLVLSYRLAETNLDPPTFESVRRIVRGEPGAPSGLVFTLEAFDSPVRIALAMIVATPEEVGETLQVRGVFDGGGWGTAAPPVESDAIVDFRIGEVDATAATGTLVVLSRSPLRLRVDITFEGLGATSTRLQGDLEFRSFTEDVSCS